MTRKMELMRRHANRNPTMSQWIQLFGEERVLELGGTDQTQQPAIDSDLNTDLRKTWTKHKMACRSH